MNEFLLDTNVVSEVIGPRTDPQVVSFLIEQPELWLSVIVLHEAQYGLMLMPTGRRRDMLEAGLSSLISNYEDRVLPVTREASVEAARMRVYAKLSGRVLNFSDALIAGTAKVSDLVVATRNVKDFTGLDVEVINPWDGM